MHTHLDLIAIFGIAVAVSLDALVVSVSNGYMMKEFKVRHAFRIAFFFGFFQAAMPLVGWLAGIGLAGYIKAFDHWVAFAILTGIGIKMIWECSRLKPDDPAKNCLHFPTLLLLSVATSIDALAVGVSFALLDTAIFYPILIIGGVTFVVCFIGVGVGNRIPRFSGVKLEFIGGVVLILIGGKILYEHLVQGY